jgi:hypothetical protein
MSRWLKAASAVTLEICALAHCCIDELRESLELLAGYLAPHLATGVVVRLERPIARIYERHSRGEREVLSFPYERGSALPDRLDEALAQKLRGVRATVALAEQDVLQEDLTLPHAVEHQLDQLIGLKLERELPLRLDSVCADHWIVRRLRPERQIVVRVVIAHRKELERLREHLGAWGLRLIRIGIADEMRVGRVRGSLLPPYGRGRLALGPWDRLLLQAAGSILAAWLLIVLVQWAYERAQVGAQLEKAELSARTARRLRAQFEQTGESARALARIAEMPDAADALLALTDAMPNDSWVSSLDVAAVGDSFQIHLSGFTPVATLLADRLSRTPSFKNVQLTAASSAGLGSGDHLELTALLKPPVRSPHQTNTRP